MRKRMFVGLIAGGLSLNLVLTAFAGQWKQDNTGWWYDNGDGTYPSNTWQWIDGNGDNVSECYYFDSLGYCLIDGKTPDGFEVDKNGAWIKDGVIQTQRNAGLTEETVDIDDDIKSDLACMASHVYDSFNEYPYAERAFPVNAKISDLTSKQKAYMVYAYQYNFSDPRFADSGGEYHVIKERDLLEVMKELLGSSSKEDISALRNGWYIGRQSEENYYFSATGDFGDAGYFYLSVEDLVASVENGRLKIVGNVMEHNRTGGYSAVKKFTAYYVPHSGYSLGGYRFDQLIVE
jgi:hypothetical protein